MSEYIDQLFDNLRRDPFASDPTASTTFELQAQDATEPTAPVGWIAEGVISDVELVDGATLVTIVDTLPTLPLDAYPAGKVVYLSTDKKLYRTDGSTWTAAVPATDITGTITETQISDSAITTPKLAANAVVAGKIAAATITSDKIAANTIVAGNIAAGTITATEIATGTITANKIQAGTITANEIANSTITGGKIAGTTITAANIQAGTITGTEISNSTITGGKIASATITGGNIAGTTITAANITAGTITATEIANSTITGGKIAGTTITAANISDSTLTNAKLVDATITGAKIASATITDANIGSLNAGKLTAGAITIAPSGGVSAITSTNFNVTNTGSVTANDITLGGPTITVASANSGRVSLIPATGQGSATIYMDATTTGSGNAVTRAAGSANCVVTYSGGDIAIGMFITATSANATFNTTYGRITAVNTTVLPYTFTYQTSTTTPATSTLTSWTAYKTLQVLGPQITQFWSSSTNPGSIGTGSAILGNNAGLLKIGTPNFPIPADGEIVFNSPTTSPTYVGGGNLYSRTGSSDISTSGDFMLGTSATSTQGDIRFKIGTGGRIGAFSTTSGNTSIGVYNSDRSNYAPLVASGFYPNQGTSNLSHNGTNFTMNDTVAITGALTTTLNVAASTTMSASSNITAGGFLISNGGGLNHDTPTGVTLASGSTVGRTALWTLNSGTSYNLQRWTSTSTAVLKKNIRDTEITPEQVYNLELVDFEYDLDKFAELYPQINVEATGTQRGVIWEQVADVIPEAAVDGYGPGDPPTIDWEKLYFAALVAIKDLNDRLKVLEES